MEWINAVCLQTVNLISGLSNDTFYIVTITFFLLAYYCYFLFGCLLLLFFYVVHLTGAFGDTDEFQPVTLG